MAERDTFVTVSNGDQLNEGYFNGIVTAVTNVGIHRKLLANASEVTTSTADTYVTVATTTFGALNALLTGLSVKCKLKSSGNNPNIRISFTGTNLGTKYVNKPYILYHASNNNVTFSSIIGDTDEPCLIGAGSSYLDFGFAITPNLKLLDASTTVTVELKMDSGSGTVYCDDFELELVYVETFTED